ncbi:MAG TPA: tetratricopeptide repeat protein [Bacteroidia bacterium]|nr:tetratricopeptide repeat protein [Bacteroidia bacterium]
MKRILLFFSLLIFSYSPISAQQHKIDSLQSALKTERDDTNKVNTLNILSEDFWKIGKYDTSMMYAKNAQAIAEKTDYKKGIAEAFRNIGIIYVNKGDYINALGYIPKALELSQEIGDKPGIAAGYGRLANIYWNQGNYPKALDCDLKALDINQQLGNKKGIAGNLNNTGLVYFSQHNYPKALEYYLKALEIKQKLGDKYTIAISMGNIGLVYYLQGNYQKSLEYAMSALQLVEEIDDKEGIARNLSSVGSAYKSMGYYSKALEYDMKALNLGRKIGDKSGMANILTTLGSIHTELKNYSQARIYLDSALMLSKQIGEKEDIGASYNDLAVLDSITGNYKQSLEEYKSSIVYRDSMNNEVNTKKTVQEQMNFDFEQKQAAEKAEQDKKDAVTEANKRRQNIIIISISVGLFLVLFFAIVLLNRFRITQQQKRIIEEQKHLVEEKNKDITDSIHYASRIQRALLTTDNYIGKRLTEYFILFKPRDIVSGDFYWANEVKENGSTRFLICAGDCTGHGVPGAFMSLLNISMLNEATIEKGVHAPAAILDNVREHIIRALNPEGDDAGSKDGMDCVLCSFDLQSNKLDFACANNPLWIMRGAECIEFKGDKMPVGIQSETHIPFTLQSVPLQKGDVVYLFTDGYADQFGGPKGKKFKYKQLQEKLSVISCQSMSEQKNILEKTFEEWKGGLEQVDDVLIIGIRV